MSDRTPITLELKVEKISEIRRTDWPDDLQLEIIDLLISWPHIEVLSPKSHLRVPSACHQG